MTRHLMSMLHLPRALRPRTALAVACAMACLPLQAQTPAPERVVVTGAVMERIEAEAPYAISVVDGQAVRDAGPMINLSEALSRVPGLVVNNRNNYAQDLQMSSRGFGARASFGVRGLRLYSDGIPATMPDGQGQVSHFDLASAERIEVLRGPFSVLYGNSSGGVISMFTAPVARAEAELGLDSGSFGLHQMRLTAATPLGAARGGGQGADLRIGASAMEIEGFRPHSAASRGLVNLRVGWHGEHDRIVLLASDFDQPAQDPLGLTPEDYRDDPYQTVAQATDFNTRKEAAQQQLGMNWQHRFGDAGVLRESQLALYTGRRSVTQWQAIPPFVQIANPGHGGGVVDFDRRYQGLEGRLRWGWEKLDVVAGIAIDEQVDDRRGYENFIGAPPDRQLGVTGALRRNEVNRALSRDAYVQGDWAFAPTLTASAGVRSGSVHMKSSDHFITADNGDDSGERSFHYTNPVLGLRWQVQPGWQWHASMARGFESPTLGELAYPPGGGGGFNEALQPQTSRQFEFGTKWRSAAFDVDAVVFRADTDDEIGVLTSSGGRATYQNVGRTRREGVELSTDWRLAPAWRTQFVATWLNARYRDDFDSPAGPVPAANRIAGTQEVSGWAELVWSGDRWGEWGLEWRAAGDTTVNDLNTDNAPGYAVANLRWTKRYDLREKSYVEVMFRVDNLADREYVGSVIVNDANRRWYETAAPRSVLLSVRLHGDL